MKFAVLEMALTAALLLLHSTPHCPSLARVTALIELVYLK